MVYIRTKTIKGKKYGYLVECKYRKRGSKGPKQCVKAYIGRVHHPENMNKVDFYHFSGIKQDEVSRHVKENPNHEIIEKLVEWELLKHGFDKDKFRDNVVLKINEGHLCKHSIEQIKDFKPKGNDDMANGRQMAKLFVHAGIDVPHELFVEYFKKISR